MFSEVLKFVPKMDRARLNTMVRDLSSRLASVTKRFGQGLKGAMRFGPLLAIGGAIAAKILDPLKKAEEIVDRLLAKGDDAVTFAEEFGSNPGALLRLEALGQAKGLDPNELRTLLLKFQSALATEQEAAKKGEDAGTLREFVGETDIAEAFFKFIQSMQALDASQRTVVQGEIFGEKIRGKASELFNAKDFAEILAKLPSVEALETAARRTGALSDQKDLLTSIRESEAFVNQSNLTTTNMIKAFDAGKQKEIAAETEDLKRFQALKDIANATGELTNMFNSFVTDFMTITAPALIEGIKLLSIGINRSVDAVFNVGLKMADIWVEFKNSRVWKYFSGGKK
jgi:hypothetical protein